MQNNYFVKILNNIYTLNIHNIIYINKIFRLPRKHWKVNVYWRTSRRHFPQYSETVRGGGKRAAGWLVVLSACVIRDPVFRRGDVFIAQFFPSYRPYTESYVRQGINIGKICCYYWVVSRGWREGAMVRRRRLSQGTEWSHYLL